MEIKKRLWILCFMFYFQSSYTQTSIDIYNSAKSAYEKGKYSEALQNLVYLEQTQRTSPKVQSLLVYTYLGMNDGVRAKIALEKYKRLKPYGTEKAHRDLLALDSQIYQKIEEMERQFQKKQSESKMSADQVANRIAFIYNSAEQQKKEKELKDKAQWVNTLQSSEMAERNSLNELTSLMQIQFTNRSVSAEEERRFFETQIETKAVTIGSQKWLNKNHVGFYFRNGDPIYFASNESEWNLASMHEIPACRYPYYNSGNENMGLEYNFYAVSDPRNLAPQGWKVPEINDWKTLFSFVLSNNLITELHEPNSVYCIVNNVTHLRSQWNWGKGRVVKADGKNKTGFSAVATEGIWRGGYRDSYGEWVDRKDFYDQSRFVWWANGPLMNKGAREMTQMEDSKGVLFPAFLTKTVYGRINFSLYPDGFNLNLLSPEFWDYKNKRAANSFSTREPYVYDDLYRFVGYSYGPYRKEYPGHPVRLIKDKETTP